MTTLSTIPLNTVFTSGNELQYRVVRQYKLCTLIKEIVTGLEKHIPKEQDTAKLKLTVWFEKGMPVGLCKQ